MWCEISYTLQDRKVEMYTPYPFEPLNSPVKVEEF